MHVSWSYSYYDSYVSSWFFVIFAMFMRAETVPLYILYVYMSLVVRRPSAAWTRIPSLLLCPRLSNRRFDKCRLPNLPGSARQAKGKVPSKGKTSPKLLASSLMALRRTTYKIAGRLQDNQVYHGRSVAPGATSLYLYLFHLLPAGEVQLAWRPSISWVWVKMSAPQKPSKTNILTYKYIIYKIYNIYNI